MGAYEAVSPDGRKFHIEGDSPPSESDLDEIFKANPYEEKLGAADALRSLAQESIRTGAPVPKAQVESLFNTPETFPTREPTEEIGPGVMRNIRESKAAQVLSKPFEEMGPTLAKATKAAFTLPFQLAQERAEYQSDEESRPISESIMAHAPSEKTVNIASGIAHGVGDLGSFFTSPLGIATLGTGALPAAVQRAIAVAFTAQMASDLPDIADELAQEFKKPENERDYQKISKLATSGAAGALLTTIGAKHGLSELPVKPKGEPNAKAIRSDTGQPEVSGVQPEGVKENRGGDIQQPSSGAPNAPAQATPDAAPKEVTPLAAETAPKQPTVAESQPANLDISVGPGASSPSDIPRSGNPDIYGIAERVREERAKAGQVAAVPPGEGISAKDSVEHGRELLNAGTNPEEALSRFEKTKAVSADDMAVARAHGERLAFDARRIEEKFGTNSPEYKAAWKALSDWDTRTKPMQTEWHKIGQAQQGETDIDTGSFTGLQRAHREATGNDFTPDESKTAKKTAKAVKDVEQEVAVVKKKLLDHLSGDMTAAEKRALDAANKTVRENAVRVADAETKQRVAKTVAERKTAKIQLDAAKKTLDAANKRVRDMASKAAEKARKDQASPARVVWERARSYIDKGLDNFDDIRNKVATDLGVPVKKVTELMAQTQRAKFLADELWRKQQIERRLKESAKRWLTNLSVPKYKQALQKIPRWLFSIKVGFHGTVALGTHAPMVAFQPRFWKAYVQDFAKMYKMVGRPTATGQAGAKAYYENQIQDLMRRPNYILAQRSGLVNDPFVYEEYAVNPVIGKVATIAPKVAEFFNNATDMGNRGYAVLKILRQDMFDQMWNKLPKTAQIPEVAEAIADGLNHTTGVVKGKAPSGSNVALFAPRLMASRVMWLAGDPIRAADTFLNWKDSSIGERQFAINQIKEKAWVAGTYFAMLAINQGLLSAMDSDQKINGIPTALGGAGFDPMRGDFMKFKVAGMDFSYGNAMMTMARLPVRLYRIRTSDGGKMRNVIYPDEDTYTVLGEYGRSQLSPFASLVTDLWLKSDWMRRQLPNSNRPMPKRLRQQGVQPYTWPEFLTEQFLPIPAEEAVREVWKHGLGMSDEQVKSMGKAMATIAVMSATGARLTDDTHLEPKTSGPLANP